MTNGDRSVNGAKEGREAATGEGRQAATGEGVLNEVIASVVVDTDIN